ncbi:MAG: hypothetical protein JJ979_09760 [Roseibium sp.]|nr:hypothetical protein [Roseibium sp.]
MTDAAEMNRPGCFGSALCYKPAHPECHHCIYATACAPEAQKRLENLRDQFGIRVPKRRTLPVSEQVTADGLKMIGEVPVKVAEFLGRCDRANIKITEALREGRNPFEKKPIHMRIACHLLLKATDGVDLKVLKQVLQKKLGWEELTANSYVIQACQTLIAVGAAEQRDFRLYLKA